MWESNIRIEPNRLLVMRGRRSRNKFINGIPNKVIQKGPDKFDVLRLKTE